MDVQKILEIREHSGAVYSCKFHNGFIYSASADKFVTRWDPKLGTQDKFALKFEHAIYSIELFENVLFAGLNNGDLHFIDIEAKEERKYFQHHKSGIFALKVNPFNNQLYAGDAEGNLSIWDLKNEKHMLTLPFDCGKIRDVAVREGGMQIALACQDGSVRILETQHFNLIDEIKVNNDGVNAVMFHPENKTIITGGKDAHLDLWSESGERLKHIPAHNFGIYRIMMLSNGFVTASRDASVKLWTKGLDFIQKITVKEGGHTHSVNDISIIDDHTFVSVGDDRRVIVWKLT